MWNLEYLDKDDEQEYLKLLFDKVKEKREVISLSRVKRYLTNKRLEKLLISKPSDLYSNISSLKYLFNHFDYSVIFCIFISSSIPCDVL